MYISHPQVGDILCGEQIGGYFRVCDAWSVHRRTWAGWRRLHMVCAAHHMDSSAIPIVDVVFVQTALLLPHRESYLV